MTNPETELADAVAALTKAHERVHQQIAYRNELVVRALASGTSWTRAQQITGLSRQGIANIVKAARQD